MTIERISPDDEPYRRGLGGKIAFATLARHFPRITLIGDDMPYRGSAMLHALASLPVSLEGD